MKIFRGSKTRKKAKSMMAAGVAAALVVALTVPLSVFADRYDIGEDSVSVSVDEDNWHWVNGAKDGDNNVIIYGETYTNTITVDAGATVTLDEVDIFLTNPDNAPLTITDTNNTGKAATIIMMDDSYLALNWYDGNSNDMPGVLVEEGATLDLQVDGDNEIEGYTGNSGETNTPAIQLEDGATLNISDHGDYGELDVCGAIGTAEDSEANVTININENKNLSIYAEAFGEEDGSSSAAIGTGRNSTGSATVNINGGYIYAEIYSDDADAIGNGSGSSGNTTVNFHGEPLVYTYDANGMTTVTAIGEDGVKIYNVNDPSIFDDQSIAADAYQAVYSSLVPGYAEQYNAFLESYGVKAGSDELHALLRNNEDFRNAYDDLLNRLGQLDHSAVDEARNNGTFSGMLYGYMISRAPEGSYELIYDSNAPKPAQPAQPAEEPEKIVFETAGEFSKFFVAVVGEYLPEIAKLNGKTTAETFANLKKYIEDNKLFDASGLTAGTNLTAGQMAVVLCHAAGVQLPNSDKEAAALEKLNEKGILTLYKADDAVPVYAANEAIEQFVKEFVANK